MNFLDFEKPIQELLEERNRLQKLSEKNNVDVTAAISDIELKISETRKKIFENLTPWQRVQLSRHPDRPYTLDYIEYLTNKSFIEFHGDRNCKDDKAVVGGFGFLDEQSVMFIGQQKGNTTKMRQYRNFGMANPEGYRKALRLMKLAEKFDKPVVTLIDTPGAYPGIEAEQRGQAEAIARNLYEMAQLRVPVICVIIGEGASGGALGLGVGDRILMLENTWYSVISPESCSSILWRSWDYKEKAATALKLTAEDMLGQKLIDEIIREPQGGAHVDTATIFETVKQSVKNHLTRLLLLTPDERIEKRIQKFCSMGVVRFEENGQSAKLEPESRLLSGQDTPAVEPGNSEAEGK